MIFATVSSGFALQAHAFAAEDTVALYVRAPLGKMAAEKGAQTTASGCKLTAGQPAIMGELCAQINGHAHGYRAKIAKTLPDWVGAPVQVLIVPVSGDKYNLISQNAAGRRFKERDGESAASVKSWKATDLQAFLPPTTVGSGPSFGLSGAPPGALVVASFAPLSDVNQPVAMWNDMLAGWLIHRGVPAVAATESAEDIMNRGSCNSGEKYILYEATGSHRDRALIGVSNDTAYVRGFLYSCGAISPAVYGQDRATYVKTSDKTAILGLGALLFPKFSWSGINPIAALSFSLLNPSDTETMIGNDSIDRAMQQFVDRLCARESTLACSLPPITRCDEAPSTAVLGQIWSNPRQEPNCERFPQPAVTPH